MASETDHGDVILHMRREMTDEEPDIEIAFEEWMLDNPRGATDEEVEEAMQRIKEQMDERDYEEIDPEEYTK